MQVVSCRAALLQLSEQGGAGLPAIKQHLMEPSVSADMLDVALEAAGLGQTLIDYTKAAPGGQVSITYWCAQISQE